MLCAGLIAYGTYSFIEVNVEAYPDPAPAIIEVIAQYLRALRPKKSNGKSPFRSK